MQETSGGKLPLWDPENPKNKEVLRRRGLDDEDDDDDEPVYQPPPRQSSPPQPVSIFASFVWLFSCQPNNWYPLRLPLINTIDVCPYHIIATAFFVLTVCRPNRFRLVRLRPRNKRKKKRSDIVLFVLFCIHRSLEGVYRVYDEVVPFFCQAVCNMQLTWYPQIWEKQNQMWKEIGLCPKGPKSYIFCKHTFSSLLKNFPLKNYLSTKLHI